MCNRVADTRKHRAFVEDCEGSSRERDGVYCEDISLALNTSTILSRLAGTIEKTSKRESPQSPLVICRVRTYIEF